MGRLAGLRGVVGFAARYAVDRLVHAESRQAALAVGGVAIAVCLLLSVTSVAIGLAAGPPAAAGDYWVVPDESADSVVTGVEGQRLGQVHATTQRIRRIDGVIDATPVLATVAGVDDRNGRRHLFVVGIIPGDGESGAASADEVLGLSTAGLSPGDPQYANGTNDGPRTGEAVLSVGAAESLSLEAGGTFSFATGARGANRTFRVVAVEEPRVAGVGQFPVVVVHLSELQTMTGAAAGDTAGRIRVSVADPAVADRLEGIYPRTEVVTDRQLRQRRVLDSRLTLAVAAAAVAVAVAVGCLFVATTMGFELAATHRSRAVMRAVGLSRATIATVVAVQTLTVCLLGGGIGVLLWLLVAIGFNVAAASVLSTGPVVAVWPILAVAGMGVALLVGILALPYLLFVSHRTTASEALTV